MIAFNNLSLAFGQRILFFDVNLNLNPGKCYALVGANGTGKSSFFKLITGEDEVSSGEILIPKEASIGWLKQDQFRYENTPIRDIVLQGKDELWQAMVERDQLLSASDWDDKKGIRFAELEEVINHFNGYSAASEAETILKGLGIAPSYYDKPLNALSGGYKLRVLLAQVLFQSPSILLLDEPTNHLDILSIRWLEKFLISQFKGLVIFISHDMDFINNLADHILDLDYGEIRQYSGNYEKFLSEKQLIQEQRELEKKSAESKISEMQKFIDRFGAKASKATQARSRMKMIEKIEIPDIKKSSRVAPYFHFEPKRPSGKQVIKASGLSKQYGDKVLFKNVGFEIARGEKVALMGVNGIGKSTLVKILLGLVEKDTGEVSLGHEVHLSYFSQDHHELLNQSMSMLTWLQNMATQSNDQQIRKALGQMLFVKDDVGKDILTLSGGEAARLLMAKIILESPNFLILDEPTNHMDLETIESLTTALQHYSGTLLLVSHNRHFIQAVTTRVLYVGATHTVQDFKGKYSDFQAKYLSE